MVSRMDTKMVLPPFHPGKAAAWYLGTRDNKRRREGRQPTAKELARMARDARLSQCCRRHAV